MKIGYPVPPGMTKARWEGFSETQRKDLARIQKLSTEFESFFMKEVVSAMRDTVPEDGLMHGGNAERVYKSLYDDQLSQEMAKSGNSGISESLFRELSETYLQKQPAAATQNKEAK